jgi:hypothetical protein
MAKSSVFKLFETNKSLEKDGVWINYGDVKFLVARAGAANTRFSEVLKAKIRPLKFQIEKGLLPPEEDARLSAEIYAETVVKDVQVKLEDQWQQGVPAGDGSILPFSVVNVKELFLSLPDLFLDLKQAVSSGALFLNEVEEMDRKNSKQS